VLGVTAGHTNKKKAWHAMDPKAKETPENDDAAESK
jgi:hypothetical protein